MENNLRSDFAPLLRVGSMAHATANELREHRSDPATVHADAADAVTALSAQYRTAFALAFDAVTPGLRDELSALLGHRDGQSDSLVTLQFAYVGLAAWCAAVIATTAGPQGISEELSAVAGSSQPTDPHIGYL
jgi:hypothetical protein